MRSRALHKIQIPGFLLMWILNGIPPFKRDKLFPFILILPVNKHPIGYYNYRKKINYD
jgi:hypothetical protein